MAMLGSTGRDAVARDVKQQVGRIPKELEPLLNKMIQRSICQVQVAALLVNPDFTIISTGWNHMGFNGLGEHAEVAAVRRCYKLNLPQSTIYVAAVRLRNGNIVTAKPCEACQRLLDKYAIKVVYRDKDGVWK